MHAKVWKCTFRYSGVCKMYQVWGEGGGTIPWGGGGGNTGHGTIYHIYIPYMDPMALAVLVVCDVIDVMMFLFFRRKFQRL